MSRDEFYRTIKSAAMKVKFPELQRLGQGGQLITRFEQWERWTNGQDPIYSTYHGNVEWKGTAGQLLAQI